MSLHGGVELVTSSASEPRLVAETATRGESCQLDCRGFGFDTNGSISLTRHDGSNSISRFPPSPRLFALYLEKQAVEGNPNDGVKT